MAAWKREMKRWQRLMCMGNNDMCYWIEGKREKKGKGWKGRGRKGGKEEGRRVEGIVERKKE